MPDTAAPGDLLKNRHDRWLAAIAAILCVSSQVKIAEIQIIEMIYFVDLALLLAWLLTHPDPIQLFRPFYNIGARWLIFSLAAIALAVWNLQQDFYVGESVSVLKQPMVVTFSRIGELFLDVFYMIYFAAVFRANREICRWACRVYYWVGIAGAVYSFATVFLVPLKIYWGADDRYRLHGFNNEGGSYGTYVLTLIFLCMVMREEGWLSKRTARWSIVLFVLAILGSQSKAAVFEIAVFFVLAPVLRARGTRVLLYSALSAVIVTVVLLASDIPAKLRVYTVAIDNYQILSASRPNDLNTVAGRTSGLYLAPKMIAARPLVGIGLGNYPIVRDDPQYRRGTPIVATSLDSPSLGPIDYIVDLGFPLFLYFTWVEIAAVLPLMRARASFGLFGLVFMQPMANWFGAHLNLTYPWVAAAIGLGVFYSRTAPQNTDHLPHEAPPRETPLALNGAGA